MNSRPVRPVRVCLKIAGPGLVSRTPTVMTSSSGASSSSTAVAATRSKAPLSSRRTAGELRLLDVQQRQPGHRPDVQPGTGDLDQRRARPPGRCRCPPAPRTAGAAGRVDAGAGWSPRPCRRRSPGPPSATSSTPPSSGTPRPTSWAPSPAHRQAPTTRIPLYWSGAAGSPGRRRLLPPTAITVCRYAPGPPAPVQPLAGRVVAQQGQHRRSAAGRAPRSRGRPRPSTRTTRSRRTAVEADEGAQHPLELLRPEPQHARLVAVEQGDHRHPQGRQRQAERRGSRPSPR